MTMPFTTREKAASLPARARGHHPGRILSRELTTVAHGPSTNPDRTAGTTVLKFGGTSLATPRRIADVVQIVLERVNDAESVIVVSAFHGVTNQLLECARLAQTQDPSFLAAFDEIAARHRTAVRELFAAEDAGHLAASVDEHLAELSHALHGIHGHSASPNASLDYVASFGERLSALIVAGYLNEFRPAQFVDARDFIVTDDQFTRANVHLDATTRAARRYFAGLWSGLNPPIAVVTGFIGSTADGRTTTIGRNGSDYTAALVGAALRASMIEIWTDVDGVLSADPRTVRSAFVLPELSYEQAHEMSYFGAKVLHPATIAPAVSESIPILIKNTFNPTAPGTIIGQATADSPHTISISSMPDVTLLTLRAGSIAAPALGERLFRALAASDVDPFLTTHASCDRSVTVAIRSQELTRVIGAITDEFREELQTRAVIVEQKTDQAMVALVGRGGAARRDAVCRVLGSLEGHGIDVNAVAESGTSRSVVCVVDAPERTRALKIIHRRLFDSRHALALAVIGVGNVGGALLDQIADRQNHLAAKGYDLRVVAVANSRQLVIESDGVDLSRWRETLAASPRLTGPNAIADALASLDLSAGAVVDCTASDAIVEAYPSFAAANLHVVTPNKRANVLPQDRHAALRETFKAHNRQLLYEANVGAGLPIISTIRDLIASGDRIQRIEGLFSGTLSFLFNAFDGTARFSDLVREAHQKGFTEPDPREDLTGLDVARKLLILAREAGAALELADIHVEPLVTNGLLDGAFSHQFFDRLADCDDGMASRVQTAKSRGAVLRYVGTLEGGVARAGLQELPLDHPLASTKGTDNSIAFTTDRYSSSPLVIQGPGAGAVVTAMGVFSDILRLLQYLPQ